MKMRRWQEECLQVALAHYKRHRHFLCLATPGAGKSIFAAELVRQMTINNDIDLVLCFSPSVTVATGLRQAMEMRLARRVDGSVGAAGGSYTYQNLLFLKQEFWSLLDHYRVLVIFDEIHHCSGTTLANANRWGEKILLEIKEKAAFTLALTGTPWRSDNYPIVLSHYNQDEDQCQVDFRYGLRDAINDGVCRMPKICIIENETISITDSTLNTRTFTSVNDLCEAESSAYTALIHHDLAIKYMLSSATVRLNSIQQHNKNSAGLVIAATVAHAEKIAHILRSDNQKVIVVSYHNPESASLIEHFRSGTENWIVSVGMISEGTDIPRLQICCYLSPIKTELHYRQVLGRVLRRTAQPNQEGWLYTFAEPKLVEYANRVSIDVPGTKILSREVFRKNTTPNKILANKHTNENNSKYDMRFESTPKEMASITSMNHISHAINSRQENTYHWGHFREAVVEIFNSPFHTYPLVLPHNQQYK